ncbi:hypothetical protein FQN57_003960 [Myotisia sp. PD_48]|nr:hypothetical protein FQN57_003960 [Myotisia sp. PD_48]
MPPPQQLFPWAPSSLRRPILSIVESQASQPVRPRTSPAQFRQYQSPSYRRHTPFSQNASEPQPHHVSKNPPVPRTQFRPKPAYPSLVEKPIMPARHTYTPQPPQPAQNGIIIDEFIPSRSVCVVQEDGKLGEAELLRQVLFRIDRKQSCLLQVRPKTEDRHPVCKIVTRESVMAPKDEPKALKKPASISTKQIELNWAIDPHDLLYRLGQLESFLDKGKRVQLILTRKPKKRKATPEEAEKLVKAVESKMDEIGVTHVKPRKGNFLNRYEYIVDKNRGQEA